MNFQIAPADEHFSRRIEEQLLTDLRQCLPQTKNMRFVFSATNDSGDQVGGVSASTAYSWLLIKILWVQRDYRRSGLGKALLNQAESAGRDAGCHSAWLDTSNPDAKLFYDKNGYTVFGELQNNPDQMPASHTRWFMKKPLI